MIHEQRVVAIAADYADALLIARRWQRTILLVLVLIVIGQLAIFFTAHFAPGVLPHREASPVATTQGTARTAADWLHYATALTLFAGLILSILLTLTLFLTIHIMLVGRLIGVRDVTRALTTSFLLLFLFIPWQTLLVTQTLAAGDFTLPGILFTWREVSERVPFHGGNDFGLQALYWGRFVAWPLIGLILLLLITARSGRGLKYALGEEAIVPGDDRAVAVVEDRD